jgi:DNA modification methylase
MKTQLAATNGLHNSLQIEWVPVASLRRNAKNPRKHSARNIRQLVLSIQSYRLIVPLLVDDSGLVLSGHARLAAAEKLKMDRVPVIRVSHLSAEQAKAFAIADNRLAEIAKWDEQLLGEILSELSAVELDFSLEATGFTMGEMDLIIEGISPSTPDEEEPLEAPSGIPVSKAGDLWLLRDHRVLCGNSLEPVSFATLMRGERAHAVFTDPPYNVRIQGHASGKGRIRHREFAMASGEMNELEFTSFLMTFLEHLVANTVEGSLHFLCMDWRHLIYLLFAGRKHYTEIKNLCVWVKDNAGMGSLYRSQHELIGVFKKGTAPHRNNVELGRFGRNRSNVWQYPGANTFSRSSDEGNLLAVHPTVKPVSLVADAIMDCTSRAEIVLDAFLGSGTTLIAAERVGRRCYGIELDPLYVDAAIRRWQLHTGACAVLAGTTQKFDEIAAEVEKSDE